MARRNPSGKQGRPRCRMQRSRRLAQRVEAVLRCAQRHREPQKDNPQGDKRPGGRKLLLETALEWSHILCLVPFLSAGDKEFDPLAFI